MNLIPRILTRTIKHSEQPEYTVRNPTVRHLAERYWTDHVQLHCKPSTARGYADCLQKYILPIFGDMRVTDVTRAHVSEFHSSLRDKAFTANRCLEMISKMFNLAEVWGWRPDGTNPKRHLKKFKEAKRTRCLTKEEAKRFAEVLNDENPGEFGYIAACALKLLLFTGCRLNEILTMRWEYINFDQSVINLPDSKTGPRTVYASPAALGILREIERNPRRPLDNPYVIYGRYPGKHMQDLQHYWKFYRDRAGLDKVRIHDLRHSFASFAINDGVSLAMVGKLLGHSQLSTTERYAHLMSEPLLEAAGQVGKRITEALMESSGF